MAKKIVIAHEFVIYQSHNGGYTGEPVGFVFARTKTEAAKMGRQKYGRGTYSAHKVSEMRKESFPYWLRTGEPRPEVPWTGPKDAVFDPNRPLSALINLEALPLVTFTED